MICISYVVCHLVLTPVLVRKKEEKKKEDKKEFCLFPASLAQQTSISSPS